MDSASFTVKRSLKGVSRTGFHDIELIKPTYLTNARKTRLVVHAAGYVNRRGLRSRSDRYRTLSPSPRQNQSSELWKRPRAPSPNTPRSGSTPRKLPVDVELEQGLDDLVFRYRVRKTQKKQMRLFMELGLTLEELSKLLRRRAEVLDYKPSTIKKKFQFLVENTDMTKEQLKKFFLKFPRILEYNMKKTVQPRLEFLLSIGFAKTDLAKILIQAPAVTELSVENTLAPRIEFLKEVIGVKPELLNKTILRNPQLFTYSEEGMKGRIAFFQEWNLSRSDIARIVSSHPQVLHYSVQGMTEHIDYLLYVGVPKTGIQRILTGFPQLLGLDLKVNVAPKLKYLQGELGGTPQTLEKNPVFVGLSLKKRIIPRHKFLTTIPDKEMPNPVPINWFKCSDEVFAANVAKVPLEQFIAFKNACLYD